MKNKKSNLPKQKIQQRKGKIKLEPKIHDHSSEEYSEQLPLEG